MNTNNFKMPVILIGNTFKYEIEATLKLFFTASRFNFSDDVSERYGDSFIVAELSENDGKSFISVEVKLSGMESVKKSQILDCNCQTDKNTVEHELCRVIYHILSEKMHITPSW